MLAAMGRSRYWASLRRLAIRYGVGLPLLIAAIAGIGAGALAPEQLGSTRHAEYAGMLATVGQLIGAVLIALALEARTPFVRTGDAAPRVLAATGAVVIGLGAFTAVLALSPDLPPGLYPWLFGAALGGFAGGLAAVVQLGIALALSAARNLEIESLRKLARSGNRGAQIRLDELGIPWRDGD